MVFAMAVLILLAAQPAVAAPDAELWPRWTANDPSSTRAIDHGPWSRFLQRYVTPGEDGIHRVRYAHVTAADKAALASYLEGLAALPISRHNRDEQLAYWINLYNALTVRVVLDHYPVASIRDIDISPGLFSDGPWGKTLIAVEGEDLSLDDIEHRILRPIWRDPRIHYALNCASTGCPNLLAEGFTGRTAEALLERAAAAYVNHPRGARLVDGALHVSSLYVWYKDDFGGSDAGVIAHLKRYAAPGLAQALAGVQRIADDDYDWSLNDVNPPGDPLP